MGRSRDFAAAADLAVFSQAATASARGAQYVSLASHDRGSARQRYLATAASKLAAVSATVVLRPGRHGARWPRMQRARVDLRSHDSPLRHLRQYVGDRRGFVAV